MGGMPGRKRGDGGYIGVMEGRKKMRVGALELRNWGNWRAGP